MTKTIDCVIIGAGPAGLSAAIYLSRYNRQVVVFDDAQGRSTYPQHNENYLGFPEGISALKLRELGRKQAQRFKTKFINQKVEEITGNFQKQFTIKSASQTLIAKTILLATGVTDIFPIFENHEEFVGKSLFWCLTCDGFKSVDKEIIIIGNDNQAACNALQFLNFTKKITLVTNCEKEHSTISEKFKKTCQKYHIPIIESSIVVVTGTQGQVEEVRLSNGKPIKTELMFSHQGSNPNCALATKLKIKLTESGFIQTDIEQRTSIKGVYAAGDVTKIHSHQIVTAAHEGATAAQSINYDLYQKYQQLPG